MKWYNLTLGLVINDLVCGAVVVGIGWWLWNMPLDQLTRFLQPDYSNYWNGYAAAAGLMGLVVIVELGWMIGLLRKMRG